MTWVLRSKRSRQCDTAFTLVELLVAMVVLSLILVLLAGLANSVNLAWRRGDQATEVSQDGRAILELIARELRHAAMSSKLQFIQNPSLDTQGQLAQSSSIFWQANLGSTTKGSLSEVGYYLTDKYELKRFFVPPTSDYYKIFDPGDGPRRTSADPKVCAPWVTKYVASYPELSTTVSNGVLGFWTRCLDINGDPIPYARNDVQYNSLDAFQPAIPGVRLPDPNDPSQNPTSFIYPAPISDPAATPPIAQAYLLPYSVELYILTVDRSTYDRLKQRLLADTTGQSAIVDNATSGVAPMGLPGNVTGHSNYLTKTYGIKTARIFSTRVQIGTR